MKRALRDSARPTSRRRRLRRGAGGFALTFAPIVGGDAAVMFSEAEASGDARSYPDAQPSAQGTCTVESF
jgi:hypothetical protein